MTRCVRAYGYRTAALDVQYWNSFKKHRGKQKKACSRNNFFDIMTPAGFTAAIIACLGCKPDAHIAVIAIVCSSFVSISRGSTGRSYLAPLGWLNVWSVKIGNVMSSRPGSASVCGSLH